MTPDDPLTAIDTWLDAGLREAFRPRPSTILRGPLAGVTSAPLEEPGASRPPPRLRESPVRGPEPTEGVAPGPSEMEGRYELLGEIARGGVGIILRGRDIELGRDVAMKVLREGHAGDPELVRRFIEEAQIAGQLQHPGIVPIYDIGTRVDGRPYFTMKLVKGQTLAALLGARRDPTEDRARVLSVYDAVCQAVAYAHARGVVHRDLKPSNVMVGAFGEVQVLDWGLAKVLGTPPEGEARTASQSAAFDSEVAGRSHVGRIMGTPRYMPPEQAVGDTQRVDERADVFALGGILAEILTGSPPYVGDEAESLAAAKDGLLEPAYARLRACGGPAELVDLALSCLAPDLGARPRNASSVAAKVAGWRAGMEERARAAESEAIEARARADVAQAHAERERAVAARARADAERHRVRAGAQRTRARQERRARRLTLGLAGSGVALAVLAAVSWLAVEQERTGRSMKALGDIESAVSEATALGDSAARSDVPEAWEAAASVARHAWELARAHGSAADAMERARLLRVRLEEEARTAKAAQELRRMSTELAVGGNVADAITATGHVIALRPSDVSAHLRMTDLLTSQGVLDGATHHARAAVTIQPDLPRARQRLAFLLQAQGDAEGALAETRAWVELSPDDPDALLALGEALLGRGEPDLAAIELRKAVRLAPAEKGYAQALEWAGHASKVLARLPAVLRGEERPSTPEAWLEFAEMCTARGIYAAGARMWEQAFAEQGRLVVAPADPGSPAAQPAPLDPQGPRINLYRTQAALCALAAGVGKGKDAELLDDAGRKRCRMRALAWLRDADADQRSRAALDGNGTAPSESLMLLQVIRRQAHALLEPDAEYGRHIESLPEEERAAWTSYLIESSTEARPAGSAAAGG